MTVTELEALLRRNGVPDEYYVLDGGLGSGECYGIEASGGEWVLYYSERGTKNPLDRVPSEDAACRLMITHLNRSMERRFGRTIPLPA